MLETVVDMLGAASLGVGLALATIGLYGLLRRPDIFHQLHASGLITGPAVILVLLASLATGNAEIATSAVLVLLFVLITSPLSSHAIAQAAYDVLDRPPDDAASADPDRAAAPTGNASDGRSRPTG